MADNAVLHLLCSAVTMGCLLELLAKLWAIIISAFRNPGSGASSVLPISNAKRSRNGEEIFQVHKEEFLRHPSVRGSRKGRQATNTKHKIPKKTANKRYNSNRIAQHSSIQERCAYSASSTNIRPPPRPPRPWSIPVPAVIITPCTPTSGDELLIHQEFVYATPRVSPLDLAIATFSPKYRNISEVPVEPQRPTTSQSADKPGSDPPIVRSVSEQAVQINSAFIIQRTMSIIPESPEKSSSVSGSSGDIQVNPEHVPELGDGLLRSTPPWLNFDTSSGSDCTKSTDSFTTSTPVKKTVENTIQGSALSIEEPRRSLRLPDEQLDLLPYPDVFDIDLYYGTQSTRRSSSSTATAEPPSSSFVRCSSDGKNLFAIEDSPHYLSSSASPTSSPSGSESSTPRKSLKREAFIPQTPRVGPENPLSQLRGLYQPHAFSLYQLESPESTSGETAMISTPTPNPRSMSLHTSRVRPSLSLSSRATTTVHPTLIRASTVARIPPLPVHKKVTVPCFDTRVPLSTTTRTNMNPLPIVIVSHHRFGSTSQDSHGQSKTENHDSTSTEGAVTTSHPRRVF